MNQKRICFIGVREPLSIISTTCRWCLRVMSATIYNTVILSSVSWKCSTIWLVWSYINSEGKPIRNEETCKKGHGRRFMFILKRKCQLPLNYDEEMAVWWHMGEYEKCKDHFTNEYEISKTIALCSLIQKADGIAANLPDSK